MARRWRGVLLGLTVFLLATGPQGHAATFVYSSPYGSATLFGDGPLATALAVNTMVSGASPSSDSAGYLDADSALVTVTANSTGPSASLIGTAQFQMDPLQLGGLGNMGSVDFTASGAGGTGSGTVNLYYLIYVPNPASIDLYGIRSQVTTTGSPGSVFSLKVYQSDSSGGKFGDAVLSFSGNNFDAEGSYQTSMPYYLIEMDVAANATPSSVDGVDFSFSFDLAQTASVPEPNSAAFLLVAAIAGLAFVKARSRRKRT